MLSTKVVDKSQEVIAVKSTWMKSRLYFLRLFGVVRKSQTDLFILTLIVAKFHKFAV